MSKKCGYAPCALLNMTWCCEVCDERKNCPEYCDAGCDKCGCLEDE